MTKNYYSKLYNNEQKVRFLEEEYPNESTRQTYASLLVAVAKFEKDNNKDACDFSYSEATSLMIGLKKKTFKSIDVAQTIIIRYVDWCIKQGYSKINFNNFKLITKEDLQKYTHKIAEKLSYITRNEMYDICNRLYNPVDRALIALLFEGVRGRTEVDNTFEELRNLTTADVLSDVNTIIVTRNNDEKRVIQVDKHTMDILIDAINQENYHKGNGEAKGRFAIMPLKDSGYVLRTLDRVNSNSDDKIIPSSISNKFRNIRFYTGINFLTPTTIFQSGLIERCEILEKEIGELRPENYRQIYRDLKLDERTWHDLKNKYEMYKRNIVLK